MTDDTHTFKIDLDDNKLDNVSKRRMKNTNPTSDELRRIANVIEPLADDDRVAIQGLDTAQEIDGFTDVTIQFKLRDDD